MTGNVTEFTGLTRLKKPVPKILAQAAGEQLTEVIVIGTRPDGRRYFASSAPDGAEILWLLRKTEQDLMAVTE